MSAEQFATRARVALCQRWPELERYNQTELLKILDDSYRSSGVIGEQQARQLEKKDRVGRNIPPSYTEVSEYLQNLRSDLNPQTFLDHYGAKDWFVGKTVMKNWHFALSRAHREWARPKNGHDMTEWERSKKEERLKDMRTRLRELTNPGGSAWPVELSGDLRDRAGNYASQIHALERDLGRV